MLLLTIILEAGWSLAVTKLGAAFAASLCLLGASFGISKIGIEALNTIARQPEAAGDVRSNMIVSSALIEGVAFFAIVVSLLVLFL